MYVIDHDDIRWRSVYRRHGRENGAATYSREICRFQIPVWQQYFPDATISTCPTLLDRNLPGGALAVQYLHAWPYENPLEAPLRLSKALQASYDRLAFVVAYKPFQALLRAHGLTALYVPMSIDTHTVREYRLPEGARRRGVAYYGNVRPAKRAEFARLMAESRVPIQHIQLKQPVSWEKLARFRYGIGVGRCAMEMATLGLRVLIDGARYGGLVMDHGHYLAQQGVNFNGRIVTGPTTLREGLDLLPESQLWTPMDSREATEWLRTEIWEHLGGGRTLHLS